MYLLSIVNQSSNMLNDANASIRFFLESSLNVIIYFSTLLITVTIIPIKNVFSIFHFVASNLKNIYG